MFKSYAVLNAGDCKLKDFTFFPHILWTQTEKFSMSLPGGREATYNADGNFLDAAAFSNYMLKEILDVYHDLLACPDGEGKATQDCTCANHNLETGVDTLFVCNEGETCITKGGLKDRNEICRPRGAIKRHDDSDIAEVTAAKRPRVGGMSEQG